jgi:hypothetical protein
MLFGDRVAVYCVKHTEQTDTLCVHKVVFLPHRKHISSFALFCQKNKGHTKILCR